MKLLAGLLLAVLLLAVACSGDDQPAPAAAPVVAAPAAPVAPAEPAVVTRTVKTISSVADLTFTDGGRLHLKAPSPDPIGDECVERRHVAAARKLLVGKAVTIVDDSSTYGPELTLPDGRDYQSALSAASFNDYEACGIGSSTPSSSSAPSDTDVDVDVDRDHHESRFCRHRRWC